MVLARQEPPVSPRCAGTPDLVTDSCRGELQIDIMLEIKRNVPRIDLRIPVLLPRPLLLLHDQLTLLQEPLASTAELPIQGNE